MRMSSAARSRLQVGSVVVLAGVALVAGCSSGASRGLPGQSPAVSPHSTLAAPVPDVHGAAISATDRAAIASVLSNRARAVVAGDRAAFLATGISDSVSGGGSDGSRTSGDSPEISGEMSDDRDDDFDRVTAVPWVQWEYEITALTPDGSDRATADVTVLHRIAGFDAVPAVVTERITLARSAGGWRVMKEKPAGALPLWKADQLSIARADGVIAIGVGAVPSEQLARVARLESRALAAVSQVLPQHGDTRAVVVLPESQGLLESLLDRDSGSMQRIAALTTASGEGTSGAERVWVNPDTFAGLEPVGRDIVLRHETTHLVVRAATTAATPMWLEEGFAEYVGYRGSGVTLDVAARDVLEQVASGQVPRALPSSELFRPDNPQLAAAYHQAWLACLVMANRWGTEGLVRLYDATATGSGAPEDNVDAALAAQGSSRAEVVSQWRTALQRWARGGAPVA